jgi:energy-coupling factor transporter ATP-binding protein EcfA2
MRLKTIRYSEHAGTRQEWELEDLTLGSLNLLVGKNSSGKTRTLNIINGLAKMLCGEVKSVLISGNYDVTFENGGKNTSRLLTNSPLEADSPSRLDSRRSLCGA